jgi:transposase
MILFLSSLLLLLPPSPFFSFLPPFLLLQYERKTNEKLERNTQQLSMLENERRGIQQKSSALEEALSSMASLLEEAVKKSDEVEAALKHHLGNKAGPILVQLQRNQQLRRGEF